MVNDTFWHGSQGTLILSGSKDYKCPMKDCGGVLFMPKETGGNYSVRIEKDKAGHCQILCSNGHIFIGSSLANVAKYKPEKSIIQRILRR